jgi:hypothetical protein
MKTIIINGQRELAELPELWYTDGTEEANEWGKGVNQIWHAYWDFVGSSLQGKKANGWKDKGMFPDFTYITPSEFLRLVYEPWKEKVKLPETYSELIKAMDDKNKEYAPTYQLLANHINACIQLTNIMNFANDAFEGDGSDSPWEAQSGGRITNSYISTQPIRFTSAEAAEWAYKTFPEIFKAYWNV